MSDAFDFGSVDTSFLDTADSLALPPASGGDLFGGANFSFPSITLPGSVADIFGGVTPPTNLPISSAAATGGGISGFLGDLASFTTKLYQTDAQLTAAKSAADIARAKSQNALETVKTTPNVWLVLGIGAAGLFALGVMDRQK